MRPERLSDLRRLVALSEAMRDAAKEGAWERLSTLERERRGGIETFFATVVDGRESRLVETGIRRILDLDRETAALGQGARSAASDQLRALGLGRQAENAYRQHR